MVRRRKTATAKRIFERVLARFSAATGESGTSSREAFGSGLRLGNCGVLDRVDLLLQCFLVQQVGC